MDTGILAMLAMASVLCNANEYHHVNVGPEAFVIRDQERQIAHSYRKSGYAAGVRLGYEYLEPNNFYFGIDGKCLAGTMTVSDFWWFPKKTGYLERQFKLLHKSLEARVGYNFLPYRDLLITPYIGVGDRYVSARTKDDLFPYRMNKEELYVVHGIRTEYILGDSVHFGLNLKEFCTMRGTAKSNVSPSYINPLHGGCEISFPWAFKLHGRAESFVVKFEPYFRKDNMESMELSIGSTLQISCDF